jgi:hypothetical protein
MRVITNNKIISRNRKIGQITTFASLIILGFGLYLTFTSPSMLNYSFLSLIVGFILSQIGIYYASRYGRSPRPDERLNAILKGLDNNYYLYHYMSPISHLLVGPAGIWAILPYSQKGTITYDSHRGRWRQKGGSSYFKIFTQEGLGRPDIDARSSQESIERFLKKNLNEENIPPVHTLLVFTDNGASIQVEDAPVPTLASDKMKEYIRKQVKSEPLPVEQMKLVQSLLPTEDVG